MNRVGGQSKYNYGIGTYTTIKFMLLQSKSARRLQIDSNYNEHDLVTTSRKSVPPVNNILPTMNYTCWRKKGPAWWNNEDQEWVGVSTAAKIVLTHRKKYSYVEVHVLAYFRVTGWCKNHEQKCMVRFTTATKLVPKQQFKKGYEQRDASIPKRRLKKEMKV
jgi:hypothetical protein